MAENPLKRLSRLGQSPWLDFIQRSFLLSGELARRVEDWGISGVTSNPAIFEKAIAHSPDYDRQIAELRAEGMEAGEMYEALAVEDVRTAADILRHVFDGTDGRDGFVSLEVSPRLVHGTAGTVAEARRLFEVLDRPNVMIKVPATDEGLPAIRQLIGEGVNVNVTLLFSLEQYARVSDAYLAGLEDAAGVGLAMDRIASVASFFLSRIDTLVDVELDAVPSPGSYGEPGRLKGEVAIASARCAYAMFRKAAAGERYRNLAARGARPQRLLWASTGTKNPEYNDVKYVEPLIAPDTVSTMPLDTLEAYHDHGNPEVRLTDDDRGAREVLAALGTLGVNLAAVTDRLLEEGIDKFARPFDSLLEMLAQR